MTVIIEVECDGLGCAKCLDLNDYEDLEEIEEFGWWFDEENDGHYCPKCTKEIMTKEG